LTTSTQYIQLTLQSTKYELTRVHHRELSSKPGAMGSVLNQSRLVTSLNNSKIYCAAQLICNFRSKLVRTLQTFKLDVTCY